MPVAQDGAVPSPRRRNRNLARPFVNPITLDDEMKEMPDRFTPVKNPSIVRLRGKSSSLGPSPDPPSHQEEVKADRRATDTGRYNDTTTPAKTKPLKEENSTPGSSPFSDVNFFQSPAPPKSPSSALKRTHEDDVSSSRKKRETVEPQHAIKEPSPRKVQVPATPLPDDSFVSSQFETPDHRDPEPVAPYTAPVAARSTRPSFVDGTFSTYSTGKPSLRTSGAGRRISFMPKVEQLQVSQEFSNQLGTSQSAEKKTTAEAIKALEKEIELEEKKDIVETEPELEDKEKFEFVEAKITSKLSPFFQVVLLSLMLFTSSAFLRWWVEEKFAAGYCEAGFVQWKPHYSTMTPGTFAEYFDKEYLLDKGSQILDYVRPECQPCPMHATCFRGLRAECDAGFVKEENVLAKYLPIPPVCRPDTQTKKRVQMLVRKAVSVLRDRNAQAACGEDISAEIEQEQLRDILYGLKATTLSDSEFSELWNGAIADLVNEEEVVLRQVEHVEKHQQEIEHGITTTDGSGHSVPVHQTTTSKSYLRSTSLANISVMCAIRRSIVERLNQHRGKITLGMLVVTIYLIGKYWLGAREMRRTRAEKLASTAIARLKEQRKAAIADDRGRTPRSVPVPQLRDEVQPEVISLDTRKKVWKDVEVLVETNANVRARQSEVDGEIMRVWEWVGV